MIICSCGQQNSAGVCRHFPFGGNTLIPTHTVVVPQYHFYDWGNYVSCNMYWALGMECPHH